jgi:DNA-binding MarR family transcriptional regulator
MLKQSGSGVRTRTGPRERDEETARRILELFRTMKRYIRWEFPPVSPKGLSEEKLRCMAALRFLGKSHLKALAAYDALSPSSQCIMLTQLVQEGFVSRSEDSEDRRNVFYELTDTGLSIVDSALAGRITMICERLVRLGETEKSRFASALATVIAGVEKLAKA